MKSNFIKIGISVIFLLNAILPLKSQTTLPQDDYNGTPDTIKVILLVSDTSEYKILFSCEEVGSKDTTQNYKKFFNHSKTIIQPYCLTGYSVRLKKCCIEGNNTNYPIHIPVPYYTHLFYLDENKQPLSPTIIIWQSILAEDKK